MIAPGLSPSEMEPLRQFNLEVVGRPSWYCARIQGIGASIRQCRRAQHQSLQRA